MGGLGRGDSINPKLGLMQKALIFNNVSITFIKRNDNKIHFGNMGKDETINTMKLYVLKEQSGHYKIIQIF